MNAILDIANDAIDVVRKRGKKKKYRLDNYLLYQDDKMYINYFENDVICIGWINSDGKKYDDVYVWSQRQQKLDTFVLDMKWIEHLRDIRKREMGTK